MENKHAALIAAAILSADGGVWNTATTLELAERLESWVNGRS